MEKRAKTRRKGKKPGPPNPRTKARVERFCQEYCVDLNGTKAVIRAGFSETSAGTVAWGLLKDPQVKARIQEILDERCADAAMRASRLREEMLKISVAGIEDIAYIKQVGKRRVLVLKNMEDWPRGIVAEVKQLKDGTITAKLVNKIAAGNLLAKLDGLIVEKKDLTVDVVPKDIKEKTDTELQEELAAMQALAGEG